MLNLSKLIIINDFVERLNFTSLLSTRSAGVIELDVVPVPIPVGIDRLFGRDPIFNHAGNFILVKDSAAMLRARKGAKTTG